MFRRNWLLLLLIALLLLGRAGKLSEPSSAAAASEPAFAGTEAPEPDDGVKEVPVPAKGQDGKEEAPSQESEESLSILLSSLAACETDTAGSTRRLAALAQPLWVWAAKHSVLSSRQGELRDFAGALSETERGELKEQLRLLQALSELPDASLSGLLEEAGCREFQPPERELFAALLEELRFLFS